MNTVLWKKGDWKWFGNAGHFICANHCRFHMTTQVGPWLVSTVGQYWPERGSREIHAKIYDPGWLATNIHLKGDTFDAAYFERFGYEEIGCDRKFETMVFEAGEPCTFAECACGLPKISGHELAFNSYNRADAATKGHLALCEKFSTRDKSWLEEEL